MLVSISRVVGRLHRQRDKRREELARSASAATPHTLRLSMSVRARTGVFAERTNGADRAERMMRAKRDKKRLEKGKESWDDQLVVVFVCGMAFGIMAEKTKLTAHIRAQFAMSSMIMIKFFLAAAASGMAICGILSIAHPWTSQKLAAAKQHMADTMPRRAGVLAGGAMIGAGMAITNSCPATAFAQAGCGMMNAWYVIAGGVFGSLVYGFAHPMLQGTAFKDQDKDEERKLSQLTSFIGDRPEVELMMPIAGVLAIVAMALEIVFDWRVQLGVVPLVGEGPLQPKDILVIPQQFYMHMKAWAAAYAGFGFFAIMTLHVLILYRTPGSSRAYLTVASLWTKLVGRDKKSKAALAQKHTLMVSAAEFHVGNWIAVFYCLGSWLGAYGSSMMGEHWGEYEDVSVPAAFVGGALMLFGCRLAGGCPTGHGLSGMAILSTESYLAVAAMFGSAIVTQTVCGFPLPSKTS